jgi:transcriptional regulator GlxA family with amidase domain
MDDATWDYRELIEAHAAADRSTRARVRRLVAWILEDPARPRSIEELADRAAVSVRTLSRIFRSEMGTTPARFVESARVALARALLEETGLAIGAIAARCGFASDERMRRAFHRSVGTSPRAYASAGSGTMRR